MCLHSPYSLAILYIYTHTLSSQTLSIFYFILVVFCPNNPTHKTCAREQCTYFFIETNKPVRPNKNDINREKANHSSIKPLYENINQPTDRPTDQPTDRLTRECERIYGVSVYIRGNWSSFFFVLVLVLVRLLLFFHRGMTIRIYDGWMFIGNGE